jgi:hypothetical protein
MPLTFSLLCFTSTTSKSVNGYRRISSSFMNTEYSLIGNPSKISSSNKCLIGLLPLIAKFKAEFLSTEVERNCLKVMILPFSALGSYDIPLKTFP